MLDKKILTTLRQLLENGEEFKAEYIHTRSNGRGGVLRLNIAPELDAVVKVWYARNVKERLKGVFYCSNANREWRMHSYLYQVGINVPKPLFFNTIKLTDGTNCQFMALVDLGNTTNAMAYLKNLIQSGNENTLINFENRLIDSTFQLVSRQIIDIDHQMNNFLIDSSNSLYRIDFECARRYPKQFIPRDKYAQMIARFILGHVHTVQPNVELTIQFTERLYNKLAINNNFKENIQLKLNEYLTHQHSNSGINVSITLP